MSADLTLEQLAAEIGTTKRTLIRWQNQFPECPKTREPSAWEAFMEKRGLGACSLRRNAPISQTSKLIGETEASLRIEERKVRLKREQLALGKATDELIETEQMKAGLAIMVGGFRAELNAMPGRIAQQIIVCVRVKVFQEIKKAFTPKQSERLEKAFDALDYVDVAELLEDEVSRIMETLHQCNFLPPLSEGGEHEAPEIES